LREGEQIQKKGGSAYRARTGGRTALSRAALLRVGGGSRE